MPALAAVGVLHLAFLLVPPLLSPDVFGYVGYARLDGLHGGNPYVVPPAALGSDPVLPFLKYPDTTSPYGPLFLLGSLGLAPLGVAAAVWTLKALTAVAAAGCLALVWSCARQLGRDPLPAVLLVGLNPIWLVEGVGGAHNDVFMTLAVLAAVRLALAAREASAAAAVVAAAAIKGTAGLLLPFLLMGARRGRRAIAGAAAAGAGVAGLALLAFGPHPHDYLTTLAAHHGRVSRQSGPAEVAAALGMDAAPAGLRHAATAAFAGALLLYLWRVRAGMPWLAAAAWMVLALLVTTSWLLPWYVALLLPLVALAGGRWLTAATLVLTAHLLVTRLTLHAFG